MKVVRTPSRGRLSLGVVIVASACAALTIPLSAQTGRPPDGSYLFKTHCASCHGLSGKGDGPLSEEMRRQPSDLTEILKRHGGNFPADKVFRIIDGRQRVSGHGGPDMPVWGDVFRRSGEDGSALTVTQRIEALVAYLESIQARRGF